MAEGSSCGVVPARGATPKEHTPLWGQLVVGPLDKAFYMDSPKPFLTEVFHQFVELGDDRALCAGFERQQWRADQLAEHVLEWLPEFALPHSELEQLGHSNAMKLIRRAAKTVYQSEKYEKRGEFGEILLHIAMRQLYETLPAISKIFYKTSANETVKGFDAVHVVRGAAGLELWVGETKFYRCIKTAIRDVVPEIIDHLETDYLRSEFIFIANKIDPNWPEAEALNTLIDQSSSIDQVFASMCIPVLLTYESATTARSKAIDIEYCAAIENELKSEFSRLRTSLCEKYMDRYNEDFGITLHVIVIPLANKDALIQGLDRKLKGLQA